jgi:hypothetical protein
MGCQGYREAKAIPGLTLEQLRYDPESVIQYQGTQEVQISPSERVVVKIEIASRGIGTLKLLNDNVETLEVRIFDTNLESDVSTVFEGGMHSYRFIEVDGDSTLEFQVDGDVLTMDDDVVVARHHRNETYKYDSAAKTWRRVS